MADRDGGGRGLVLSGAAGFHVPGRLAVVPGVFWWLAKILNEAVLAQEEDSATPSADG